jgi:hypothetical protein
VIMIVPGGPEFADDVGPEGYREIEGWKQERPAGG